ncbi:MAG: DUF3138 family protein [Burkholderiales bacterium]
MIAAIALALPCAALAQTDNAELLRELQELQAKVKALEEKITGAPVAMPVSPAAEAPVANERLNQTITDVNKLKLKVDQMDTSAEERGFFGLKLSGYADPTYIYNQHRHTNSP